MPVIVDNGSVYGWVDIYKDLGVIVDYSLKFNMYEDYVINKVAQKICIEKCIT